MIDRKDLENVPHENHFGQCARKCCRMVLEVERCGDVGDVGWRFVGGHWTSKTLFPVYPFIRQQEVGLPPFAQGCIR